MVSYYHRAAAASMEENPLWLVVLCDLMTNLMLFFLVMYSFTLQSDAQRLEWARTFKNPGFIETPKERRAKVLLDEFNEREAATAITDRFRRSGLSSLTEVSVTEDSIRVGLRNQLLFRFAEAELGASGLHPIRQLAEVLRTIPNDVVIEGHTDNVPVSGGRFRSNAELSVARAYAVIGVMAADGVLPRRLIASGYGDLRPVAPNTDEEGRARNRRVEIVILRGRKQAGMDSAAVMLGVRNQDAGGGVEGAGDGKMVEPSRQTP